MMAVTAMLLTMIFTILIIVNDKDMNDKCIKINYDNNDNDDMNNDKNNDNDKDDCDKVIDNKGKMKIISFLMNFSIKTYHVSS